MVEIELRNAVQDRILILTDNEIDDLMHKKWFGATVDDMVKLVQTSLRTELDTLQMIEDRYANTLSDIDTDIESLMRRFETLQNELVVTG